MNLIQNTPIKMKSDYTQRRNLEQQQALKDQQRKTQITEKPEMVMLWLESNS